MIQIGYEKLKIQRFDFCQVGRYFWVRLLLKTL